MSGINEGARYVREYMDKFKDELGFEPFEGTLNIKLEETDMEKVKEKVCIDIGEFERNCIEYGNVKCAPIRINGIECCAVLPKKSGYKDVLEVISKFNLRKELNLEEGDEVEVEI